MKKYITIAVFASMLIVLMGVSALAQQPPMGERGFGHGMGMHKKNLENLRMLKLLEVLKLSEEQNIEFLARFSSHRVEMQNINERTENEVEQLIEKLKAIEVGEDIKEKELKEHIEKIEKLKQERIEKRIDFYNKTAELLTTEQQAKLLVFEERFERELIESMRGFHNRRAPRPDKHGIY